MNEVRIGGFGSFGDKLWLSNLSIFAFQSFLGGGLNSNSQINPQGFQPPVISSGGGDIVLNNGTTEKKSNKRLIILGVLVGLALMMGIALMLMPKNNQGGSGQGAKNYQEAFNKYANYYLYGEAKTDEVVAEYSDEQESYFNDVVETGEIPKDYFSNLKAYYAEFLGFYNGVLEEQKSSLEPETSTMGGNAIFSDYRDVYYNTPNEYFVKLQLLTDYYSGASVNWWDIVATYGSDGQVATQVYIQETLSPYKELGKVYDASYYDLASEWGEKMLDLVALYNGWGCLSGETIDYACVNNKSDGRDKSLSSEISDLSIKVRDILVDSEQDLYQDLFLIQIFISEVADDASE